jgi:hypothetical protein
MANELQKDILNKIRAQPELAKHVMKIATILQKPEIEYGFSLIKDDPELLRQGVNDQVGTLGNQTVRTKRFDFLCLC